MSELECRLLIWCALMLVRETPLSSAEADEIDRLIAGVRATLPRIAWKTPAYGEVERA